jgi:AcrR family transcriptional regulator
MSPARRADARRNYEILQLAAREIFDEQGCDAPLEDVARRAGVGNATMYRHFAARHELIIAAYADEANALCARAATLAADLAPADALFAWLREFAGHLAPRRDLALALIEDRRSTLFDRWHQAMLGRISALLARARHAATIRPDLLPADLLLLTASIALTGGDTDRLLDILRTGTEEALRPTAAPPAP